MKKATILFVLISMWVLSMLSTYGISSGRTLHADEPAQETAQYKITFTSTWSNETHPSANFPGGAHFSRLVGATHNQNRTFWSSGALATDGIKDMAERGNNANLKDEVEAAIGAGTSDQYISGNGLGTATGMIVLDSVDVHQDYPLVTLVSMIAPSPDWFVGVSAVPLLEDGEWVSSKEITLYPYDAGTDDGEDYGSPNAPSNPRQNIANISNEAPFSILPIGTLTFTRLNAPDPTATATHTATHTATATPTTSATATVTPTPSPLICPVATHEPFMVDYISPTELTTQTLSVRIGNGDAITVTAPAGVYTATGDYGYTIPVQVPIDLLPNQVNEMEIAAHVRDAPVGDCPNGNYTLRENISIRHQSSPIFRVFAPVIQRLQ